MPRSEWGGLDARQFFEWVKYSDIEPFGPLHEDWRAGVVAATVANSQRTKGKAFMPWDYFPSIKEPEQTEEQMYRLLTGKEFPGDK